MRKTITIVAVVVMAIAALGVLSAAMIGSPGGTVDRNFEAFLSGDQEVPGVATDTGGRSVVRFNRDFSWAKYRLVVRDGVQITAAHLHCGKAGANGPVVAPLFSSGGTPVDVNGELASGTLRNVDIIAKTATECKIGGGINNIVSLADAMMRGWVYANVHSSTNPGGEVRGQHFGD